MVLNKIVYKCYYEAISKYRNYTPMGLYKWLYDKWFTALTISKANLARAFGKGVLIGNIWMIVRVVPIVFNSLNFIDRITYRNEWHRHCSIGIVMECHSHRELIVHTCIKLGSEFCICFHNLHVTEEIKIWMTVPLITER